jgi:hypothetical protein
MALGMFCPGKSFRDCSSWHLKNCIHLFLGKSEEVGFWIKIRQRATEATVGGKSTFLFYVLYKHAEDLRKKLIFFHSRNK